MLDLQGKDPLKLEKIMWAMHNQILYNRLWCNDGPSEKVIYQTCQKLSSMIENYNM